MRFASQPCDSCVECVVVYQRTFSSPWSCRWFLVGWTMATQCYVHGLPDYQYRCLQSVLHAAARSIYSLRRCEHVTPALIELHWLSAVDRVNFKVATLVYRCLHGLAPPYLSSTLHRVSEVETRRRLRSLADTDILLTPRSRLVTAGDRLFSVAGPRAYGTTYRKQSAQHRRCRHSNDSLKLFYFIVVIPDNFFSFHSQWTLQFVLT